MRRWVRYEAPIMVCVEFDDDSHNGNVVNVVLATDHEDIALARDYRGQCLVYDKTMKRIEDNDPRPVTIADHREWPQPDDWEQGPDALRFPGLYDGPLRRGRRPGAARRRRGARSRPVTRHPRRPSPGACRASTDHKVTRGLLCGWGHVPKHWAIYAYDQNIFTEWHSRYGGRGVLIYWHVERKSMAVHSQLINCSASEVAPIGPALGLHLAGRRRDPPPLGAHRRDAGPGRAGFDELRQVVRPIAGDDDIDVATEVLMRNAACRCTASRSWSTRTTPRAMPGGSRICAPGYDVQVASPASTQARPRSNRSSASRSVASCTIRFRCG
jgi:hypothetical protein